MAKLSARCPGCSAGISFDESLIGKRLRCKGCQTIFIAPAAGQEAIAVVANRVATMRPHD